MPAIYAIGETIYDIIFKNNEPVTAKAGGAMLNTTVSLGRLGLPVSFISEIGNDQAGNVITDFLGTNGVDSSYTYRYAGKTIIALAFLQENNDAKYSFYKYYPEDRLKITIPDFDAGDIVLFGAFYSLMKGVRKELVNFVKTAKKAGALILYDPNIRSPHKDEIIELREMIYENFMLSDIIRGSDEDFQTMFNIQNGKQAYELVKSHGCHNLIYTKSNTGVEVHTSIGMKELLVPKMETASTIGAGDSFNAGLIYELFRAGNKFSESSLPDFAETAIRFGSHVCTHYENYITEGFAKDFDT